MSAFDYRALGLRIKTLRKRKGFTQQELADSINKSLRTVQKYETGEIEVSLAVVNQLAEVLETTPIFILGYDANGAGRHKPDKPRLTEAELAICKAVGAKWVSRNKEEVWARLWSTKPEFEEDGLHYRSNDAILLALANGIVFPSVHPGDLVCVEEAGGNGFGSTGM